MGLRCSISYQLAYSTKTRYYLYFFSLFFSIFFLFLSFFPPPLFLSRKREFIPQSLLLHIETNTLRLCLQFLRRIFLEQREFHFAELINNGQFFPFFARARRSYRILIVVGKEIKTGERERKFIAC